MTLVEMTIAVLLVAGALFLLTGWMNSLRDNAHRDLCTRMLSDLDEALMRYRRTTGAYPVLRGHEDAASAVADLLDLEKTRNILDTFPDDLWRREGMTRILVDPWGTPLRYVGPDGGDHRVVANGGRPIFISAGPDRDFGGPNTPDAEGNNLRSDDPGPEGFPIHDVLRDAFVDDRQEKDGGQEVDTGN